MWVIGERAALRNMFLQRRPAYVRYRGRLGGRILKGVVVEKKAAEEKYEDTIAAGDPLARGYPSGRPSK